MNNLTDCRFLFAWIKDVIKSSVSLRNTQLRNDICYCMSRIYIFPKIKLDIDSIITLLRSWPTIDTPTKYRRVQKTFMQIIYYLLPNVLLSATVNQRNENSETVDK